MCLEVYGSVKAVVARPISSGHLTVLLRDSPQSDGLSPN